MEEIITDVHLNGCDVCGEAHSTEDCPELITDDNSAPTLTHARTTLPPFLSVVDHDDGFFSVVAKECIAAKTKLGPLEAPFADCSSVDHAFALKLFSKDGLVMAALDASSELHCNWLCLVPTALDEPSQNLMALQIASSIFFTTTRDIHPGEELRVWYAPNYARKLTKSQSPDGSTLTPLQLKRSQVTALADFRVTEDKIEPDVDNEEEPMVEQLEVQETVESEMFVETLGIPAVTQTTSLAVEFSEQQHVAFPRDVHILHETSEGAKECQRCHEQFNCLKDLALHIKSHLREEEDFKKKEQKQEKKKQTAKKKAEQVSTPSRPKRNVQKKFSVAEVLGIKLETQSPQKSIRVISEIEDSNELDLSADLEVIECNIRPCYVVCEKLSDVDVQHLQKLLKPKQEPQQTSKVIQAEEIEGDSKTEGVQETMVAENLVEQEKLPVVKKENKRKKRKETKETEEGELNCDHCDKVFSTIQGLEKHQEGHDFPFECDKCHQKFMMKTSLSRHNCQSDEKFFCEFCGACFKDKSYLLRHMATHTREFTCEKCSRSFARKETLLSHLIACDPEALERRGLKAFPCTLCKKVFGKEVTLKNHMALHDRKHVCEVCGKAFSTIPSKQRHVCPGASVLKVEEKLFCSFCPKSFFTEKNLQQHMQKHLFNALTTCMKCGKSFSTKNELKKHTPACTAQLEGGNYKCSVCQALLPTELEMKQHYEQHSHPYVCDKCGKRFIRVSNLRMHSCKNQENFACEICEKQFSSVSTLRYHMDSHEKTHECDICKRRFSEKKVNNHLCRNPDDNSLMKMSRDPSTGLVRFFPGSVSLVCSICGKKATNISNLNMHVKRHGEKKEPCDLCGKLFLTQFLVKKHKEAVHTAFKAFSCSICHKSYKTQASLSSHQKVYHNGSHSAFQCSTCQKEFRHKGNLKKHMLVHSNKKNFKCKECSKEFRAPEQLHHHEMWHKHGLRFKCTMCEKAFVMEGELRRHAQQSHGGITYTCKYCDTDCHFANTMKRHLSRTHMDVPDWQSDPIAFVKSLAKQDPRVLQRLDLPSNKDLTSQETFNAAMPQSIIEEAAPLEALGGLMEEEEPFTSSAPVIMAEVQGMEANTHTIIIHPDQVQDNKLSQQEVAEAMRSINLAGIEANDLEQHVILPSSSLEGSVPMEVVMGDGSIVYVPMVGDQAHIIAAEPSQIGMQSLE